MDVHMKENHAEDQVKIKKWRNIAFIPTSQTLYRGHLPTGRNLPHKLYIGDISPQVEIYLTNLIGNKHWLLR